MPTEEEAPCHKWNERAQANRAEIISEMLDDNEKMKLATNTSGIIGRTFLNTSTEEFLGELIMCNMPHLLSI